MSNLSISELFYEFIVRLFIILPVPLLIFFIASLVLFLQSPKGSEKRRKRKIWFIVISITAGIMFLIWLFVAVSFVLALSHM